MIFIPLLLCAPLVLLLFFVLLLLALQGSSPPSRLVEWLFPSILFRIHTAEQVVVLTIDDAPREGLEGILSVLRALKIRATFFVISDQIPGREKLLQQAVREGHELQNHGASDLPALKLYWRDREAFGRHLLECEEAVVRYRATSSAAAARPGPGELQDAPGPVELQDVQLLGKSLQESAGSAARQTNAARGRSPSSSPSSRSADLEKSELRLEGGTASFVHCYRPGGGLFSRGLIRETKRVLRGDRVIALGSVYPFDAGALQCPTRLKKAWVPRRVHPGAILIMHDREANVEVFEDVLPRILAQGYRFVTLSEAIGIDTRGAEARGRLGLRGGMGSGGGEGSGCAERDLASDGSGESREALRQRT